MPLPPANPSTTPPQTSPSYWGQYQDSLQPTLNGVVDYINEARVRLQDQVPPYRYLDQELVTALNIAMLEVGRVRSDLVVYNLKALGQIQSFILNPFTNAPDNTYVDLDPQFRGALVNGICGFGMTREQEDFGDARATAFLNMFYQGLIGKGIGPVVGGAGPGGR